MKIGLIFFSIIFTFGTTILFAQKYIVDTTKENEVRFFAEATFNNFEGITNSVKGYMILDNKNHRFDFRVMLDSLDTGIGLRNEHMRNILHTGKYPFAEFKGTVIRIDSIGTSKFNLEASGDFFVNGVTKNLAVNGKLYNFGALNEIESSFNLKLSDFNIERPSFLFNKLHNLVKLKVIIFLKRVHDKN